MNLLMHQGHSNPAAEAIRTSRERTDYGAPYYVGHQEHRISRAYTQQVQSEILHSHVDPDSPPYKVGHTMLPRAPSFCSEGQVDD